ncbi:hypothetical protein GY45DRAFT_1167851 [Cubamyces sp. BRFM 1775]|nr:hypothetical protein GY45DRAFT_1167851 [Cubamyces sp. BRFM 1775]
MCSVLRRRRTHYMKVCNEGVRQHVRDVNLNRQQTIDTRGRSRTRPMPDAQRAVAAPSRLTRVPSVVGPLVDMMIQLNVPAHIKPATKVERYSQLAQSRSATGLLQKPCRSKMDASSDKLSSEVYRLMEAKEPKPIAPLSGEDLTMVRPVVKARLLRPLDVIAETADEHLASSELSGPHISPVSHVPMSLHGESLKHPALSCAPPSSATPLAQVGKEYLRMANRPRPALQGRPGPFLHSIKEDKPTIPLATQTMGHAMLRTKGKRGTPRRPQTRRLPDENAFPAAMVPAVDAQTGPKPRTVRAVSYSLNQRPLFGFLPAA